MGRRKPVSAAAAKTRLGSAIRRTERGHDEVGGASPVPVASAAAGSRDGAGSTSRPSQATFPLRIPGGPRPTNAESSLARLESAASTTPTDSAIRMLPSGRDGPVDDGNGRSAVRGSVTAEGGS